MLDAEEDIVLSFNGEIYNFKELRKELAASGVRFISESDTEVILRGYGSEGKNFLAKLRGMWALAIYDRKRNELVLSRDHFGIKPLYYAVAGSCLHFASELGALRTLVPGLSPNSEAYYLFYNLGYFPGSETCYKEAKKVEPGEVVTWDFSSNSVSRGFFLPLEKGKAYSDAMTFEEAAREMEPVLENSVRAHYVSDVPVSILLSGGVDSSLIAAISKKLGKNPAAYHVAIPGSIDTEYARKIADHLGLPLTVKEFDAKNLTRSYANVLDWIDSPTSDVSIIPTSVVYASIAGESKVVLSGEGGDELFGGYMRHSVLSSFRSVKKAFSSFLDGWYLSTPFGISVVNPILARLERWKAVRSGNLIEAYLGVAKTAAFPFESARTKEFLLRYYDSHPYKDLVPPNLFFDLYLYLPDSLMYKNDIASMRSSIEARVPLIDRDVLSQAARLPDRFRLSAEYPAKALLKKLLSEFLPPKLVDRPKKGFGFSFAGAEFFEDDYRKAAAFHRNRAQDFGLDKGTLGFLADANAETVCRKFPRFAFSLITNWKIFSRHD
jgi:asparagine synthase (glutamine-hydrolysing)